MPAEYEYPGRLPDRRPASPSKTGPIPLLVLSPTRMAGSTILHKQGLGVYWVVCDTFRSDGFITLHNAVLFQGGLQIGTRGHIEWLRHAGPTLHQLVAPDGCG